ncbi:UDP-N-acetylmuramoyl-L-alanyl-D-glutamate--2,6-diaminopimelate ligase [Thermaurantimonas aggregans]|uniref:UDP-N-acetylmuramoyl-L-alanyl-D-glutamate--2,6-diaminopimelate ligase n=1 Tax=Thermaurantimonas aggregans TaxID=2173829 RepID=A0A401XLQ7_9FLAO|nr:UDP-N-acetylmuramoyl-L-alanyl-D-glutamate--2,6-diaminopimelate ligase [Thermaurantimonas aggregans]MCX8147819.1 UDP-N-acetylmuramoyl-L-alanyl-D-glutamate--2,6-diaminopimelate ligase [Thermaurantimonas aggregans]GCD77931.1 UDP-N-acetylmuramoyl-L-alanyl-D-glutamate--2,6-diaminopimelate ligase [Thermaurantimonas aggregans]
MKVLKDILYKVNLKGVRGNLNQTVSEVAFDSRKVVNQSLFVAVAGTNSDGHNYIEQAINSGAMAIVCEHDNNLSEKYPEISFIYVENSARALGVIASNFYGNPSEKLKIVAVTGTNGKTTVTTQLYEVFKKIGFRTGLISTVRVIIHDEELPATHTTPDALSLQKHLAAMADAGVQYCFMEASSHGIHQERLAGTDIAGAVFTNITHDHLDYHKTFANYIAAKQKLFNELPSKAFALYNADDRNGQVMVQNTKAKKYSYALKQMADFHCKIIENNIGGLTLRIGGADVYTALTGEFNAYNLLAVYAVAVLLGVDESLALMAISSLRPVEGRFETLTGPTGQIAIVDYAHTPDALLNVLKTLHESRKHDQQIITVFGCGGDRDKAKRPEMGKIAADWSDRVIITSDNPRSEDPEQIIAEIEAGIELHQRRKCHKITDRREAIRMALSLARKGDVVLVAGKGHEKYQEIKGVKHPFDDKQVILDYYNQL